MIAALLQVLIGIVGAGIKDVPGNAFWTLSALVVLLLVVTWLMNRGAAGRPAPSIPRRSALPSVLAVVLIAGQAVTLVKLFWPTPAPPPPPAVASCPFAGSTAGVAVSVPSIADGLRFCPVRVNGGSLPITGPFTLEGRVIGDREDRQQVLLLALAEATTCDALGNPGTGGYFLQAGADIGSADGTWSTRDPLGYPEAVTIRRKFTFVSGVASIQRAIEEDRAAYKKVHKTDKDYPGLKRLPPGTRVLSEFEVDGGKYAGPVRPCRAKP